MTAATSATSSASLSVPRVHAESRLPSVWAVGLSRAGLEVRQFFRERDAVVFVLALPVVLLVLLGSIIQGTVANTGVPVHQVLVPGMIAAGIASTSFLTLGIDVAREREDGTLKRLAGTPTPKVAYFLGKAAMVSVVGAVETVVLVAVGVAVFGVHLPSGLGHWLTFVWVIFLGMFACSLLGIAIASLPRSARSAPAVVNLPFIALEFASGVFVSFNQIPHPLQQVAAIFPLKWMAQGLRSVFLPNSFRQVEMAHSWELGMTALVLVAWCVIGLLACLMVFRWQGRRDG